MSESSSVARPYAQAVFELAREADSFAAWSNQLQALCDILDVPDMQAMIGDPRVSKMQILEVVMAVGESHFDASTQNLVRILVHYRRLGSAAEIKRQFESLRAAEEGVIQAELETAYDVEDAQLNDLIESLQSRLGRKVRLTRKLNQDLIGGVVIRAGDWVIDDSIRSRLGKLSSSLGV